MGVGVCVTAPNNNNKVIKVNQLEDKENVIDNFNYEEYAVDKDFGDGNNLDNNISNNDIMENKQSSERKKVKNVFKDETENENSKKLEETKKEEEKKMEETKKEEEKKVEETKKEEEKKIEEIKKEEEKKIEEIKKENITKEKNQKNNLEVNQNEFVDSNNNSISSNVGILHPPPQLATAESSHISSDSLLSFGVYLVKYADVT